MSDESSTVETPQLIAPPIYGKWTVTKCIFNEKIDEDNFMYRDLIGDDCLFSNNEVIICRKYIANPSFRIKRLEAAPYLYRKYNIDANELELKTNTLMAIDVLNEKEFYYEILKTDDNIAYIITNGVIIQITRSSDELTDEELKRLIKKKQEDIQKAENAQEVKDTKNGFLLGLKFPQQSKIPNWSYKTFYFKFKNDRVENVFEVPNILLPRKTNFADVEIQRKTIEGVTEDRLVIKDRLKNKAAPNSSNVYMEEEPNVLKSIQYISPEYINLENIDMNSGTQKLRIYWMESLEKKKVLDIHSLLGKNVEIDDEQRKSLEDDIQNLGLYRDNGYWKLKGRLNLKNESAFRDFDLNLLLPQEMNKFNQLSIPMAELRKFHSRIKDAFISPNNHFLITLENNKIRIYNIVDGKINPKVVFERDIEKDAQTIMTEWAIGKYADLWQEEFYQKNKR